MKQTLDVVVEKGVLRPLRQLSMKEGQRIRVTLEVPKNDSQAAESRASMRAAYDFCDLIGHLKWRGDAVREQRRLRSEWE